MRFEKSAPGEIAVSLQYDGQAAPRVTAKGDGEVAKRILELAMEHDVPIYQNPELLQLLTRVELDEEIPRGLYVAVAEIIAFAYRLKNKLPAGYQETGDPAAEEPSAGL